ncbi:hypothetical protein KM043_007845 [Ampulex compressa]|nr:hypothetical protein KM043_007845 [Ampulex compressa]
MGLVEGRREQLETGGMEKRENVRVKGEYNSSWDQLVDSWSLEWGSPSLGQSTLSAFFIATSCALPATGERKERRDERRQRREEKQR